MNNMSIVIALSFSLINQASTAMHKAEMAL
jgi:hypothetical protein